MHSSRWPLGGAFAALRAPGVALVAGHWAAVPLAAAARSTAARTRCGMAAGGDGAVVVAAATPRVPLWARLAVRWQSQQQRLPVQAASALSLLLRASHPVSRLALPWRLSGLTQEPSTLRAVHCGPACSSAARTSTPCRLQPASRQAFTAEGLEWRNGGVAERRTEALRAQATPGRWRFPLRSALPSFRL